MKFNWNPVYAKIREFVKHEIDRHSRFKGFKDGKVLFEAVLTFPIPGTKSVFQFSFGNYNPHTEQEYVWGFELNGLKPDPDSDQGEMSYVDLEGRFNQKFLELHVIQEIAGSLVTWGINERLQEGDNDFLQPKEINVGYILHKLLFQPTQFKDAIYDCIKESYEDQPDRLYLETRGDLEDLNKAIDEEEPNALNQMYRLVRAAEGIMTPDELRTLPVVKAFVANYPNLYKTFEVWSWG